MEERNTVYKEMDQLEEKLTASQKNEDDLQKKNKSKTEELETLRREIASALQDRDQAMKQVCIKPQNRCVLDSDAGVY